MKISYRKELKDAKRWQRLSFNKIKVFITVDVRVTGSERTFLQTVDMFMLLTDI